MTRRHSEIPQRGKSPTGPNVLVPIVRKKYKKKRLGYFLGSNPPTVEKIAERMFSGPPAKEYVNNLLLYRLMCSLVYGKNTPRQLNLIRSTLLRTDPRVVVGLCQGILEAGPETGYMPECFGKKRSEELAIGQCPLPWVVAGAFLAAYINDEGLAPGYLENPPPFFTQEMSDYYTRIEIRTEELNPSADDVPEVQHNFVLTEDTSEVTTLCSVGQPAPYAFPTEEISLVAFPPLDLTMIFNLSEFDLSRFDHSLVGFENSPTGEFELSLWTIPTGETEWTPECMLAGWSP